jgi:hypothetical protein
MTSGCTLVGAHRPTGGERGNANPIAEASMSQLSSYIGSQAAWRREKAEQYPDDERNARSAVALEGLADHVAELEAARDPRVRYLVQFHQPGGPGTPIGGEETQRQISRWGFHRSDITPEQRDEFVTELCALAAQDAFEFLRDTRTDFTLDQVPELAEQLGLSDGDVARALNNQGPSSLHFVQQYGSAENVAVLIGRAE